MPMTEILQEKADSVHEKWLHLAFYTDCGPQVMLTYEKLLQ